MNDEMLKEAEARQKKLQNGKLYRALKLGMRDTAQILQDPQLQEQTAMVAVAQTVLAHEERPSRPPEPPRKKHARNARARRKAAKR